MIKMVANVGFPIALAVWLLVRMERRMEALTTAICELRAAIVSMPKV